MSDCQCSTNHDASGFTSGLLLGLVLGAGGIHFLETSNEGREILSKLKKSAGETLKDLGENEAISDKIADLQKTMDAARATINSAAEKVANATEPVGSSRTAPTHKKNFFQRLGATLGK